MREVRSQKSATSTGAQASPLALSNDATGTVALQSDGAGDQMKQCPRCPSQGRDGWLTTGDFGICRSRKDGLNLYCRQCIREKIYEGRQALRAYRKARATVRRQAAEQKAIERAIAKAAVRTVVPVVKGRPSDGDYRKRVRKLSMPERIVLSLREFGPQTQPELRQSCRALSVDELGEALAACMLWNKPEEKVFSRNGSGPRIYFLAIHEREVNAARAARLEQRSDDEPRSYGISTVYSEVPNL